jgi:hypothetical protein
MLAKEAVWQWPGEDADWANWTPHNIIRRAPFSIVVAEDGNGCRYDVTSPNWALTEAE